MFEKILDEALVVRVSVLHEFCQGLPTSYTEVDFEVEQLKLQVYFNRNLIDFEEMLLLSMDIDETCRLWKKLNDVV